MTEEQKQSVLSSIDKAVARYYKFSETMSIPDLLKIRDQLSCLTVTLSAIVGDATEVYSTIYNDRKQMFATAKLLHMEAKNSGVKAEEMARLDIKEVSIDEVLSEANKIRLSGKLKQVNEVLSAMQQRTAFARKEKEHSDYINNQK